MFATETKTAVSLTDTAITKLLRLEREDERAYADDFLGTFEGAVDNPFHVPDDFFFSLVATLILSFLRKILRMRMLVWFSGPGN